MAQNLSRIKGAACVMSAMSKVGLAAFTPLFPAKLWTSVNSFLSLALVKSKYFRLSLSNSTPKSCLIRPPSLFAKAFSITTMPSVPEHPVAQDIPQPFASTGFSSDQA